MSHAQDPAAPASEGWQTMRQSRAPRRTMVYVTGVASGLALALFAPLLRPAARRAVKGGMRLSHQAKKVASSLKEEFEDIAAEAQAEIERDTLTDSDRGIP